MTRPGDRDAMNGGSRAHRAFARVFRPFSKVHPNEVGIVALMTLTTFLLLTAYYLLKTVREPLILLQGGAEVKLYARAGQAVLMVGVVHLYGELARRVGRIRLLLIVFLFFISNLAVFAVLAKTDIPIGLPFFLWVGVFSYTVIAQFWALAADIYDEDQGKRLFPILGGGSSMGAVVGGLFAKSLVPLGAPALMMTALVILLVCAALIAFIERRAPSKTPRFNESHGDEPIASESAWRLLARDRYLLFIAGMVILLNWVNSSGEYLLDRTLLATAREAAKHGAAAQMFIGSFKADYYFWYNAIGVALQLFAVSRVLRVAGVRAALFVMPIFALGAYGIAAFAPLLAVMRVVKIGENSLQYSLQDTSRHALFLVSSRAERFVGKTAVDTIAVRLGAIMSSVMVFLGTHRGWPIRTFAIVNVGLALGWLGFVLLIGSEHRRRAGEDASASAVQDATHSATPIQHTA
jgi:AAA family ATP:ADP antiporter